MAFDQLELQRIENLVGALCRRRSPPQFRDELEIVYEVENHAVSIFEVRPRWDNPKERTTLGIARFRFIRARKEWRLYWMRRDLKWHPYDPDETRTDLETLVRLVDEDQYGAFFG